MWEAGPGLSVSLQPGHSHSPFPYFVLRTMGTRVSKDSSCLGTEDSLMDSAAFSRDFSYRNNGLDSQPLGFPKP